MDISIIIINYKTPKLTLDCVRSIYNSKPKCQYEIIVYDNNSQDNSLQKLKSAKVKLIAGKRNLGFGGGNNAAVKKAQGKYFLFLNSDTVIFPQTIDGLFKKFESSSQLGIVGPKILNPDKTTQASVFRFPSLKQFLAELFFLPNLGLYDDYRRFNYTKERIVDFVSGACFMMPRQLFKKVHGFDTRFFMYAEETDLCKRVWRAGFKVMYAPIQGLTHFGGQSGKQLGSINTVFHHSKCLYIRKHDIAPLCFLVLGVNNIVRMFLYPRRWRWYADLARLYFRELFR